MKKKQVDDSAIKAEEDRKMAIACHNVVANKAKRLREVRRLCKANGLPDFTRQPDEQSSEEQLMTFAKSSHKGAYFDYKRHSTIDKALVAKQHKAPNLSEIQKDR